MKLFHTLGSCSNRGPMNKSTKIKMNADKNPVNCVLPPEAATAKDRDMDAEDGRHRKKAPNTLQNPYDKSYFNSVIKYTHLLIKCRNKLKITSPKSSWLPLMP